MNKRAQIVFISILIGIVLGLFVISGYPHVLVLFTLLTVIPQLFRLKRIDLSVSFNKYLYLFILITNLIGWAVSIIYDKSFD